MKGIVFALVLMCCGCSVEHRLTHRDKVAWLGPCEALDAMLLWNRKTGKTNVVTYGFRHTSENEGYLIFKMTPLTVNQTDK